MVRYAVWRILSAVPVIFGVLIAVFLIMHLTPGDPAVLIAGDYAPPETVEQIRAELGLDQPIAVQLVEYFKRVISGDLGRSILSKRPVSSLLGAPFKTTLQLVVLTMIVTILFAVPAGVISAINRGRALDKIPMALILAGYSFPSFWVGLLLMYWVGFRWGLVPISGWDGFGTVHGLTQMVLPVITLATVQVAAIARLTRSCMLEVLNQDYIRTARAKGLPERSVIYRHALRNASLPVVTIIALQFGFFLGGAVVTESVFAIPGMGRLAVESIQFRDFPVIQAIVLLFALGFIVMNMVADLTYQVLDPRIRYS